MTLLMLKYKLRLLSLHVGGKITTRISIYRTLETFYK